MLDLQLEFECPKCGGKEMEEILINAVVSTPIYSIDSAGDIEYGEQNASSGEISHYQCAVCGCALVDKTKVTITDCNGLVEWLLEQPFDTPHEKPTEHSACCLCQYKDALANPAKVHIGPRTIANMRLLKEAPRMFDVLTLVADRLNSQGALDRVGDEGVVEDINNVIQDVRSGVIIPGLSEEE